MRLKTEYDPETDSLYVEVRALPAVDTREIAEEIYLDIGADGEPVGYDIQHASTKRDMISTLVLSGLPLVA